jgi:hypothetical protein
MVAGDGGRGKDDRGVEAQWEDQKKKKNPDSICNWFAYPEIRASDIPVPIAIPY